LDIFSFFVDMDVSWIMQCRIEFILLTWMSDVWIYY
jgi:hypothetical protein